MNLEVSRSTLINHSRSDRNGKFPLHVSLEAKLTNPLCGDHVELKIAVSDELISDIGFKAHACAICTASSSLLSEQVKGLTLKDAMMTSELFEKNILEKEMAPWPHEIIKLNCFEHLRVNPSRKMCALLPWLVLRNALKKDSK